MRFLVNLVIERDSYPNKISKVVIMEEYLYQVNFICRCTGEEISLFVWGLNTDDATHKITSVLCDYSGEYIWTCSNKVLALPRLKNRYNM